MSDRNTGDLPSSVQTNAQSNGRTYALSGADAAPESAKNARELQSLTSANFGIDMADPHTRVTRDVAGKPIAADGSDRWGIPEHDTFYPDGHIKSVRQTAANGSIDLHANPPIQPGPASVEYQFAENGNLISSTGPSEHTNYRYAPNGNLLSSQSENPDGTIAYAKTYQYDANGNLQSGTTLDHGETSSNTFQNDAQGNLKVEKQTYLNGMALIFEHNRNSIDGYRIMPDGTRF